MIIYISVGIVVVVVDIAIWKFDNSPISRFITFFSSMCTFRSSFHVILILLVPLSIFSHLSSLTSLHPVALIIVGSYSYLSLTAWHNGRFRILGEKLALHWKWHSCDANIYWMLAAGRKGYLSVCNRFRAGQMITLVEGFRGIHIGYMDHIWFCKATITTR